MITLEDVAPTHTVDSGYFYVREAKPGEEPNGPDGMVSGYAEGPMPVYPKPPVDLRAIRAARRISLRDAAELTGLPVVDYAAVERGRKSPAWMHELQRPQPASAIGAGWRWIVAQLGGELTEVEKHELESRPYAKWDLDHRKGLTPGR